MVLKGRFPELYPILDASFLPVPEERPAFLTMLVRELAMAGVGILQYRNKTGGEAEILADALAICEAAGGKMLLILNDWPELAVEVGFDGVHVGQADMSPAEARKIVGAQRIVGVSTHNEAQLRAADLQHVDYVAFGPVFPTATKENPDPVVGLDGLRMARGLTSKPLVAIGGITAANTGEVWAAGADSVAVISALFSKGSDPARLAKAFLAGVGDKDRRI